jgi:hypothetical protein
VALLELKPPDCQACTAFGLSHLYTDLHFIHFQDIILKEHVSLNSVNNNFMSVHDFFKTGISKKYVYGFVLK